MMFSYLISFLQNRFKLISQQIEKDSDVSDIMLLDESINFYREDTLYIGHLAQLNTHIPAPIHMLYFIGDIKENSTIMTNSAAFYEKEFAAVFNAIKQEFLRPIKTEVIYATMLKMIMDGKGLCDILNEAYKYVENPLVILDISGKILAHSTSFNVNDPIWTESIQLGYCPFEFMEHIKQQRLKHSSPSDSQAFISICKNTNLVYLCSKIFSKDTLLGYVFIFECNKKIDDQSKQLLPSISCISCEVILRSQGNIGLRLNVYRSILEDMLSGINPHHASERIQASQLQFPEHMRVVIIRPSYYHGEHYVKGQLQEALLSIFDKAPFLYYKGGIAIIVPLTDDYHIDINSFEKLTRLLNSEHLQAGASNAFSKPWHFADYYAQADSALRFSQRLGSSENLHYYENYAFFVMLNSLPPELTLGKFCHPSLGLLRKYDYENGTDLYKTLKAYTQSGFNNKHTTETLFLHRNTLSYRKQKIAEISGIDFTDPNLMFLLMYSFYIDDFLNKDI
ncbi:PucR family transcriptional regulator [Clostridium oryzae]|uniref:Carbohydrate diacid regulator n=1 Tax=Clostridium oryzae TaxID=1450648 RepID=A0A1V4I8B4_9CLOT|nr:helix-turn-helix domain-containing protein [Clostridium oryzae]OPJ56144.1 carbohydrate diacid regulator [Clostridium oryzae]